MRRFSLGIAALVASVALPLATQASEFTGKIRTLRYGVEKDRLSIEVGPHGSPCGAHPDWYSVEGKPVWINALAGALARKRTVTLVGGACDSFDVESVKWFDVK